MVAIPEMTPFARFRGLARSVRHLRGSPESIARGIALGALIAFTPTMGFQLVLATALATLLGASRPAALAAVWITNPVTIPPVLGFTYMVGDWLWPGPSSERVSTVLHQLVEKLGRHEFWEIGDQLGEVISLGRDVFVPLWLGGLLVGFGVALVAYVLVLWAVRRSSGFWRSRPYHTIAGTEGTGDV